PLARDGSAGREQRQVEAGDVGVRRECAHGQPVYLLAGRAFGREWHDLSCWEPSFAKELEHGRADGASRADDRNAQTGTAHRASWPIGRSCWTPETPSSNASWSARTACG